MIIGLGSGNIVPIVLKTSLHGFMLSLSCYCSSSLYHVLGQKPPPTTYMLLGVPPGITSVKLKAVSLDKELSS